MAIQRPVKEGSVRTYQEKVGLGFVDILASEMDADLDTIYAAWNGGGNPPGGPAGGDLTGTYPNPTLTSPLRLANGDLITGAIGGTILGTWRVTDTQTTLRYNRDLAGVEQDTSKPGWVTAFGGSGASDEFTISRAPAGAGVQALAALTRVTKTGSLAVGPQAMKLRLVPHSSSNGLSYVTMNADMPSGSFVQDDATKPSWTMNFDSSQTASDAWSVRRYGPGLTPNTFLLTLDNAGNLTIAGATATKASGTAWVNPSDRRMKDDIEDYQTGLAAIAQLQPRTFVYNGKGGSTAGQRGYGFVADEVEAAMPEMVGSHHFTREDAADTETDYQTVDQSNLILALVNAVQELAERLAAVEAAA